jgi:hypothetical protein
MIYTTLQTSGTGYWSTKATQVDIEQLRLQYCNYERDFGELCVHFTPASWDTAKDGLIYTDQLFMAQLRVYLQTIGFTEAEAMDVDYSEQGMQDDEYVSCDVGAAFLAGLERLDEAHVYTIWRECLDV